MVEEGKEEKEKKEGNRHRECDIHLIAGVSSRKTYRVRGRSAFCASHERFACFFCKSFRLLIARNWIWSGVFPINTVEMYMRLLCFKNFLLSCKIWFSRIRDLIFNYQKIL